MKIDSIYFIIVFFLVIFWMFQRRRKYKGQNWGEVRTNHYIQKKFNIELYPSFHNLIIPSKNGTSQIDHLIVSSNGLFIVETKSLTGWIFGNKDSAQWTQVLFENKYKFQNPLRQTYRQKKVLSEFLNIEENVIFPVVYFNGDVTFKNEMPKNVVCDDLDRYIKSYNTPIIQSGMFKAIIRKLEELKNTSTLTLIDHLDSLDERLNSKTICPKCGGSLIERTAKVGKNSGNKFLGCSNFPNCKFTRDFAC